MLRVQKGPVLDMSCPSGYPRQVLNSSQPRRYSIEERSLVERESEIMHSKVFLALIAPLLTLGAVINSPSSMVPSSIANTISSPAFGINLFKGNASGPCNDLSLEMAIDDGLLVNSTVNYCYSTQGNPTTCIGRRTKETRGVVTDAQRYEAANRGLDAGAHQCTVIGYQEGGCPIGTSTVAQYHEDNLTWSWDHETRVGDNSAGRLWTVLSFQVSCEL